jgi:hypothetical protein
MHPAATGGRSSFVAWKVTLMHCKIRIARAGVLLLALLALSSLAGCARTVGMQHDERDGGMDRSRPDGGGTGGGMHGGMGGGM